MPLVQTDTARYDGMNMILKNTQLYKFSLYGFLKNLRFFEPFMVLYLLEKGLSFTQIGLLYGFREIVINVLEIPTGIFADGIGHKRTLMLSLIGYIASFVIFYFASNLAALFGAMVLFSFGEACRTGTHKAMIFEYLHQNSMDDQKTAYYGYTRSWSQTGAAVSALGAGVIVFWQDSYSSIFLFSIVPYILDFFLIMSYPDSLNGTGTSKGKKMSEIFRAVVKETAYIFSTKKTFIIIGNQSIHSGFYKAGKDFIQPILKSMALGLPFLAAYSIEQRSSVAVGIIYFVLYLLTAFASRSAHIVVARTRSVAALLNGTLILGAVAGTAAGILYRFDLVPLAVLLYIGIFLLENLRKPAGVAYITDTLNPKAIATTLSAVSQASSIVTAAIAMFLGAAIDILGLGWGMAVVFGILGIISLLFRVPKEAPPYTGEIP